MAMTPAERQRASRARRRRDRERMTHSDESQRVIDDMEMERKLSTGEKLLVQEIARTKYELDEMEAQLRGEQPEWLHAVMEAFTGTEITLSVDGWHAAIDRKRSILARLLGEFRQYGLAAAKASAGRGTGSTPIPTPAAPGSGTDNSASNVDDEYRDLFAV